MISNRKNTQEIEEWFLSCAVDRLQDGTRHPFGAVSGLLYKVAHAQLKERHKNSVTNIQDWLVKVDAAAEKPFARVLCAQSDYKQGRHFS